MPAEKWESSPSAFMTDDSAVQLSAIPVPFIVVAAGFPGCAPRILPSYTLFPQGSSVFPHDIPAVKWKTCAHTRPKAASI